MFEVDGTGAKHLVGPRREKFESIEGMWRIVSQNFICKLHGYESLRLQPCTTTCRYFKKLRECHVGSTGIPDPGPQPICNLSTTATKNASWTRCSS